MVITLDKQQNLKFSSEDQETKIYLERDDIFQLALVVEEWIEKDGELRI